MSSKRGFTIIELLMVIAVVAILAAILFPVFARAREQGRKAACLSNLKQLGSAYMMYVQDYDETYPLSAQSPARIKEAYWSPPNLVESQSSPEYIGYYATQGANAVYPYTKNYQIWACPSSIPADVPFTGGNPYPKFTPGVQPTEISYMFNGLLSSVNLVYVKFPTYVPLLWEGGGSRWRGAGHANPGVNVNPMWHLTPDQWPFSLPDCTSTGYTSTGLKGTFWINMFRDRRPETHNGGQNWLFADGHAKWRKIGGNTLDTDPNRDPFRYNADGTINSDWTDGCLRMWLFRPDLEPDSGSAASYGLT